ncbi:MAG: ribosome recycling factor [Armatimonadetes bacterium]|nr:ribosome recycling factor [Armatimonadota bacterium]MDE2207890.1 ribosome recycling factor [Armatimonadota bacterium]
MIPELLKETEERMHKSVEATRHEFSLIRTGRASPAILEHVKVDLYGATMPLNQVASVSVPDPRQLMIMPFDRNALAAIEKGILKSDVNLTPNNDGSAIRLNIPPLNEERRRELIKQVHQKAEAGRVGVRNARHDSVKKLQNARKAGELPEGEEKRGEESVQKLVDRFIQEIDRLTKAKEAEMMEV